MSPEPTASSSSTAGRVWGSPAWIPDVLGVGWVLVAAVAVMLPALRHGLSLGEYDWLSSFGLLQQHVGSIHNNFAGDQIDEMIPWTTLAWTQVHQGHLPLWNPYNALGNASGL